LSELLRQAARAEHPTVIEVREEAGFLKALSS